MEKEFPVKIPNSNNDYLEAALDAEKYIDTFKVETADGIYWNELEGAASLTLYRGSAGILLMYINLHQSLRNSKHLEIIKNACAYLVKNWRELPREAKEKGEIISGIYFGLYMGIGGIGYVFAKIAELYANEEPELATLARTGLDEILNYYKENAVFDDDGAYWSGNSPVYLDSGAVLFLLTAHKILGDAATLELAESAMDYIIAHSTKHADDMLEFNHISLEAKRGEPNFEFGTAGVSYVLAELYKASGKKKYLDASIAGAKFVKSLTHPQLKGFLIPYKPDKFKDLFYLGHCHGPAGTAKLFYELYRITGNSSYYDDVIALCDGLNSLGAPRKFSAGYWNTSCVCCGPAGFIPMYIGLYKEDSTEKWHDLALLCANILLAKEAKSKTGSNWPLAFDRISPEKITSPTGYMNGAAGIVIELLNIYNLESGKYKKITFNDDPFK